MLYARAGDTLYLHGAPASRLLGTLAEGPRFCFTVTLVDGLVLARSAFHHSLNYRSVVVVGEARAVTDPDEKLAAMEVLVEHVVPGRTADARAPSKAELKVTEVIALDLRDASAKLRTGPPADTRARPVTAGVGRRAPADRRGGRPDSPILTARCPEPAGLRSYRRGNR